MRCRSLVSCHPSSSWSLGFLLLGRQPQMGAVRDVSALPAVNAWLNATSAALLTAGYGFIRRRQVRAHKTCMLTALGVSSLLPGLVCHLRSTRLEALRGPRMNSGDLLPAPHLARRPRRPDRALRADDDLSRLARGVRATPEDRPVDASGVAVRVGHRGPGLLDAVSSRPVSDRGLAASHSRRVRAGAVGRGRAASGRGAPLPSPVRRGRAGALADLGLRLARLPAPRLRSRPISRRSRVGRPIRRSAACCATS